MPGFEHKRFDPSQEPLTFFHIPDFSQDNLKIAEDHSMAIYARVLIR
jgi:hypothetical protein